MENKNGRSRIHITTNKNTKLIINNLNFKIMEKLLEKINELEKDYKESELKEWRNNNMNDWNKGYYKGFYRALRELENYIKDTTKQETND